MPILLRALNLLNIDKALLSTVGCRITLKSGSATNGKAILVKILAYRFTRKKASSQFDEKNHSKWSKNN